MNTSSAKPRASVDSELMTRVDCLHRLVSTIPVSAMSVACGGLLIAYWLYDLAPHGLLSGWLALILCMAGLRLGYLLWFRRCFDGSNVSGWEGRYAVLTGLTGLSWGALPWMPLADPNHNLLFIIVVLLFCILLATASQLVASIPALFCASVCLLTPMLARVTSLDPKLALLFTLGTVVVTTVVLLAVKEQRQMLLGALRDRHEIDELLRQQRVIFESAGEGIVFLRPRPEYVVSWNRRFAEMLGHADEVLKGMEPWRWHPAREQWKRLVIDAHPYLVAGQPYHAKMELIRADGSVFWGEITDETAAAIEDHEFPSAATVLYRVRVVRSDYAASPWSDSVEVTAPTLCQGWTFTSNAAPLDGLWYADVSTDGSPPPRVNEFIDERETYRPLGRPYSVEIRELEDRGSTTAIQLQVRAGSDGCPDSSSCVEWSTCGGDVFLPLRDLSRAGLPYLCARNECGEVRYVSLRVERGTWFKTGNIYLAEASMIDVAAVPSPVDAQEPAS